METITDIDFIVYNKTWLDKLSKNFHCVNDKIDYFIRSNESLDTKLGKTYICLDNGCNNIIAYFNLGTGSINFKDFSGKLKMGGSAHLNYFALDEKYQGSVIETDPYIKLSDILLNKCIEKIKEIKDNHIGFSFITLFSTNEGYNLYLRRGFDNIEEDMIVSPNDEEQKCIPMYLPLDDY